VMNWGAKAWNSVLKRRIPLRILQIANFLAAVHLFAEYGFAIQNVSGPSMLPTMEAEGELVLENRFVGRFYPERLARGDLVTFVSPLDPQRIVCKRILGLPGDIVCVDPTGDIVPSSEHVIIPKGHLWFGGDNASWSRDSRYYGPVSIALVRGRLVAKVWPPRSITLFKTPVTMLN